MLKEYTEIYKNGTYLKNNPDWNAGDSSFKANKILQLLGKHKLTLESVCEIGCGSGEMLVQLSSQLPNVNFLGVDISPDAIAIAKTKETSQIRFELRDITSDQFNQRFDLILVIDVIEHIENYFKFLRDVRSRGRYTVFHIPLDMCMWSLFRENMLIESKERVGHIHVFTEDFIKSVLRDCGYKMIDQVYTEPNLKLLTARQKLTEFVRRTIFKINKRFCSKTIGGMSILILAENEM
jgi:cyclopropane fatty-acyl-phospholipid synthase-like methyltransferase